MTSKRKTILSLLAAILAALGIFAGLTLVQQRQEVREEAAPSTGIYFEPATKQVALDQKVDLGIFVNTGGNALYSVFLEINYDAAVLEAQALTFTDLLSDQLRPVNISSGKITASAGTGFSGNIANPPVTGVQKIASVSFKVLKPTAGTTVSFSPQTAAYTGVGEDIGANLIKTRDAATIATLAQPTVTVLPTATVPPPQCRESSDCNDNNLCTTDTCVDGSCEYAVISCNAHAVCNPSNGECQCSPASWANCDNNWGNGCETLLTNNKEHCGSCGNACPEDYVCLQRECADIGIYPTCLIKNTSNELGIDMKYISAIEDNNAQWGEEDLCETGNIEGKKLVLQSVYPDSNNKCWQYKYHTAGAADNLTIHCNHYKLCQEQEINCPQCPTNGNFNNDGVVDEFDYGILIAHFEEEGIPGEVIGDANCDGVVDEFDYGIIIAHFGEGE